MILTRVSPKEMRRRHGLPPEDAPRSSSTPQSEKAPPRPRNVRAMLDLGTLTYFSFRGRSYGVPPLPWESGLALLDAYLEARSMGDDLSREDLERYGRAVKRMARIMWKLTRPIGFRSRLFKALGLLRNPYLEANEGEVGELAVFFLGRRTNSRPSVRELKPPPRRTSQPTS